VRSAVNQVLFIFGPHLASYIFFFLSVFLRATKTWRKFVKGWGVEWVGRGTYSRRVGWVRSVGLGPPITVMISKVCSFHRSKSIAKVEHLLPFEIAFVTGSCSIFALDFDRWFVRFVLFVALLASFLSSISRSSSSYSGGR